MHSTSAQSVNLTNKKAIPSLILGILSIVLLIVPILSVICGIIGLIVGIFSLREIKQSHEDGKKVAIAGIICSGIGLLLFLLLVIAAFVAYISVVSVP